MKVSLKLQAAYDARVNIILVTTYGARFSGTLISLSPIKLRCTDGVRTFEDRAVARVEYDTFY
jgi:hypothetical protein